MNIVVVQQAYDWRVEWTQDNKRLGRVFGFFDEASRFVESELLGLDINA